MTCPGLILWSQLPECNVKFKGSTNEHRQNPSWKRWDSSKTSQTHVWNPTFSPRNGPKSLNHSFLCHVCIFGYVFRIYSKSLLKRWFLELSPCLFSPPFRDPQRLDISRKGAIVLALRSLTFWEWQREIQRRPFLRREPWCDGIFRCVRQNPYSMRNSISWGFLWCDGGPEFFGNMMWCNIMDVYPVPKTWHHQVHHPQHHRVTPPPQLVSLTSQ